MGVCAGRLASGCYACMGGHLPGWGLSLSQRRCPFVKAPQQDGTGGGKEDFQGAGHHRSFPQENQGEEDDKPESQKKPAGQAAADLPEAEKEKKKSGHEQNGGQKSAVKVKAGQPGKLVRKIGRKKSCRQDQAGSPRQPVGSSGAGQTAGDVPEPQRKAEEQDDAPGQKV